MKITKLKVGSTFGGVISEQDYDNRRVMWPDGYEIETEGMTLDEARKLRIKLREELLSEQWERMEILRNKVKADALQRQMSKARIREKDNKQYVSVTTITSWDKNFFMKDGELLQHAARGKLIDKLVEHWFEKQVWLELKELVKQYPELRADAAIMWQGNLKLRLDTLTHEKFFEKYGEDFKIEKAKPVIFNEEHMYSGEPDFIGYFKDIRSIIDVKSGDFDWEQLAAYAKGDDVGDIEQLVIIPVGETTNDCGYMKPKVNKEIDAEFKKFIQMRNKFKENFGI